MTGLSHLLVFGLILLIWMRLPPGLLEGFTCIVPIQATDQRDVKHICPARCGLFDNTPSLRIFMREGCLGA